MRAMLIAVTMLIGCGVTQVPPNESTQTAILGIGCAELKCDLINCSTCFACGDVVPTCTCYWWDLPTSEGMVCHNEGEPVPTP